LEETISLFFTTASRHLKKIRQSTLVFFCAEK